MNLLILSYDFCLDAGGIQNTSYLLAKYLSNSTNVICLSHSDGHENNFPGVTFLKSKYSFKNPGSVYSTYKELDIICKEYRIDYILSVSYQLCKGIFLLHLLNKIPYGIMTHGNEVMKPLHFFYRKNVVEIIKKSLLRYLIIKYATNVFSNSNFTKGLVNDIVKRDVDVVQPPIEKLSSIQCINYKSHTIFCVARLVERKGIQFIIQAMPNILKIYPDMKLVIGGRGEYEENLKQLVNNLNITENVSFLGRVTEEEKEKLYNESGLFVMPSFCIPDTLSVEGYGLVFLEANSYGKFVVGTRSGGIPDAIIESKTGFLVKERNVKDIENAVNYFFSTSFDYDPEFCKQWADKHHISEISKQYLQLINNKLKL